MAAPTTVQHLPVPDALARLRDHRIPEHLPASLHEDVFVVPEELTDDGFVREARDALKAGREAGNKALAVAHATLADETLTLHRRHQLAHDRCHATTAPAIKRLQTAIDKIGEKVESLNEFLKGPKPPLTPANLMAVVEARAALNRLDAGERRKAIFHGIETGDLVTCQAVTRCPSYLLGVDDNQMQEFAHAWANKHHADVVERARVLSDVLDHVQRGGTLLLSFTVSLASSQVSAEARRLAQNAADAVAAAGIS